MTAQSVGRTAAWCGVCLTQAVWAVVPARAASANPENEPVAISAGPSFEAAVDFCTRQLTYGLVDNRDPVVALEGLAAWRGLTFEVTAIFDTTEWGHKHGGYGNRQSEHQEITFGPGYGYTFSPDDWRRLPTSVELFANYLYESHPDARKERGEENPHTQFINVGVALPDLWLSPALAAEVDIDNEAGAVYVAAEIGHAFALVPAAGGRETDPLSLTLGAGVGFGNPKRNQYDADFDAFAFKDVWATAALEWCLTDQVTLAPYVAVYEQLHGRLRDAARQCIEGETHGSTQLVGGLRLAARF